jgi:hypothetical protein
MALLERWGDVGIGVIGAGVTGRGRLRAHPELLQQPPEALAASAGADRARVGDAGELLV